MTAADQADAATRPSDSSERVLVALGSNLGDRASSLDLARGRLGAHPLVRVAGATIAEETEPLGPVDQPPYLNQMLALTTVLSPLALLDLLQEIEREGGRVRGERWGPRTLDCDIVAFGARTIRHERLVVPHPELPNRDFWQREIEMLGGMPGDGTPRRAAGPEEEAVDYHEETRA